MHSIVWHTADLSTKGFVNIGDSKLTKALSNVHFYADISQKKCFHNGNRTLIGTMAIGKESPINAVAHWDEKYEHITIQPLFLQCPSEYEFSTQNWTFSLDGKWLVNSARKILPTIGYDDPEMVFYHVDPKYPQGISPPVFAGKTYLFFFFPAIAIPIVFVIVGEVFSSLTISRKNQSSRVRKCNRK